MIYLFVRLGLIESCVCESYAGPGVLVPLVGCFQLVLLFSSLLPASSLLFNKRTVPACLICSYWY